MKMKTWVGITAAILLFVSCNAVDKLLTFNIYNQSSFTIDGGLPINSPLDIFTPEVTTNSTVAFAGNGTRTDKVKDIQLQELKLTITNPSDKTFSFLKSAHIYISTNDNDEILLAYIDDVNTASNNINLLCIPQKLDHYIKSSSYRLRSKVVTRESLAGDVDVQVDTRFTVVADPL